MIWCDKLASIPTVGFTLSPHFQPAASLLEAMVPILNANVTVKANLQAQVRFTLDRQDAFDLAFALENGFRYSFGPTNIVVTFAHRVKLKTQSAGLPTTELLSEAQPYSVLLPSIGNRLIEATLLMPEVNDRKLVRLGIVSSTTVIEEELPPGFLRLIDYIKRPWGNVEAYSFQIASQLMETADYSDRCVHTLTRSDDPEVIPTVVLDWQRTFKVGRSLRKKALAEVLETGESEALLYFEKIGEGSNFDV